MSILDAIDVVFVAKTTSDCSGGVTTSSRSSGTPGSSTVHSGGGTWATLSTSEAVGTGATDLSGFPVAFVIRRWSKKELALEQSSRGMPSSLSWLKSVY